MEIRRQLGESVVSIGPNLPAIQRRIPPLKAKAQEKLKDHSVPTGLGVLSPDSQNFGDWGELRAHWIERYDLYDATISLRADFVHSETVARFESIEITEIGEEEVLLSLSVGHRVRLCVHLIRGTKRLGSAGAWRPRESYRSLLLCAKAVFCRAVRDRVVTLMSDPAKEGVVSFFLDRSGKVDSSSSKARAFCDRCFPTGKVEEAFFPQAEWEYVQAMLKLQAERTSPFSLNESIVFCLLPQAGVLDCLIQRMGENGYLLSLVMDA